MATLLFKTEPRFDTATIRGLLVRFVPHLRWQCGDDERGGPEDSASLDRPQTIIGRIAGEQILLCVSRGSGGFVSRSGGEVPEHAFFATVSTPSTENLPLAMRISALVSLGMTTQARGSWLQLEDGGSWLGSTDMAKSMDIIANDQPLADIMRLGTPEAPRATSNQTNTTTAATLPAQEPKPKKARLGTFSIALDGDVHIDWAQIDEAMTIVDPDGGWHSCAIPQGMGVVTGRANITLAAAPWPLEAQVIADGYARSFWFDGDRARVDRHRQHITLHIEAPETYEARLATAKVVTIIVGLIAKLPQVAAVYNHEVCTIFSAQMAMDQTSILGSGELPIQLWTWTAFDSMTDGDVSMTTGGLMPFLGYEIEIWNAPHPVRFALEKLNGALRYLLISGPVINHGDTIGDSSDDQSTRCFFGQSRANRPVPIEVMFLEFDTARATQPGPDVPSLPSSLMPPVSAPAPQPQPQPLRRAGGFGRKGL